MVFACFKMAASATLTTTVDSTTFVASTLFDVTGCVYSPYVARRNMLGAGGEDTKVRGTELQCGIRGSSLRVYLCGRVSAVVQWRFNTVFYGACSRGRTEMQYVPSCVLLAAAALRVMRLDCDSFFGMTVPNPKLKPFPKSEMGGCQNYGPFLGPYYSTAPST